MGALNMRRTAGWLRWAATVVYATAVLGALIVPHGHGLLDDGCCCRSTCRADAHSHSAGECTAEHSHHHAAHGCDHTHEGTCESSREPATPERHSHEDCPYCQFLAQRVQLAATPVVSTLSVAVTATPIEDAVAGEPLSLSTPPARGPPVA
jgi:hypothetical protein